MSLVVFFVVFLLIQFARAYIHNKKSGEMKFRNFFSPSSSSSMFGFRPVKYYCMNCGTPHNLRECPKCGSKLKRVG
jgi:rubrerythrin